MTVPPPKLTVKGHPANEAHVFYVRRWTGAGFTVTAVRTGTGWMYACRCDRDRPGDRCEHVEAVRAEIARRAEDARPDARCGACNGSGRVDASLTSRRGFRECPACSGSGRVRKTGPVRSVAA